MDIRLKKVLFQLMDSHTKLSQAEYKRDSTYNNEHFSYKAEEAMINYLLEHEPIIFKESLNRKN